VRRLRAASGWSVVDFRGTSVRRHFGDSHHAAEVRIVRLDPNGRFESDQLFLDPAAVTDPFFNYAGGTQG